MMLKFMMPHLHSLSIDSIYIYTRRLYPYGKFTIQTWWIRISMINHTFYPLVKVYKKKKNWKDPPC